MRCEDVRYAMSSLDWGRRENDEAGMASVAYRTTAVHFESTLSRTKEQAAGLSSEKPMVRLRREEPKGAAPE
jgi:hypothetical protein